MKKLASMISAACIVAPLLAATPTPVIFDTDMGNDVDDALALAMLHTFQSEGKCKLIAVTSTKDHPLSVAYCDALNTFYGRPEILLGAVRNGVTRDVGRFNALVEKKDGDKLIYPHTQKGETVPDAVCVLRQALAKEADQSVAVIQVGFSSNLARLLDTPADEFSPLSGKELVAQKVKVLSIMGGAFQTIVNNENPYKEYNIKMDIPAAQKLVNNWPGRIVFSGFEIGIAIPYPAQSIVDDYNYVAHHPVKDAYIAYIPPPHNRPTWDLTSALYAVCPDDGYFGLSAPQKVSFSDTGFTQFKHDKNGKHFYLTVSPEQIQRVTALFVQICPRKPHAQK